MNDDAPYERLFADGLADLAPPTVRPTGLHL